MGGVLAALGSENSPPVPPPPRPSSLAPLPHLSPGGTEFLKTPLGGSFLVYESFLYRREKAAGDKVYWTCRDHALHGCRSRAITQGQRVMVMRRHCHPPDLAGLEALRQREQLPCLAQRDGSGAWSLGRTGAGGVSLLIQQPLGTAPEQTGGCLLGQPVCSPCPVGPSHEYGSVPPGL